MNDTFFYVLGGGLAAFAVITSFVGLRVSGFPSSRVVMAMMIGIFVALMIATTTFAVHNSRDEEQARATELSRASE